MGVNYVCIAFLAGGTFSSPPMILSAHSGQLSHCYAELEAKHASLTWMKGRREGKDRQYVQCLSKLHIYQIWNVGKQDDTTEKIASMEKEIQR